MPLPVHFMLHDLAKNNDKSLLEEAEYHSPRQLEEARSHKDWVSEKEYPIGTGGWIDERRHALLVNEYLRERSKREDSPRHEISPKFEDIPNPNLHFNLNLDLKPKPKNKSKRKSKSNKRCCIIS